MTWMLIKIAIRFVVFGAAFGFAAWKHPKISVQRRAFLPLVALVFAALNVGLYWLVKPILTLATLGTLWLATPFVVNGLLLYATNRLLRPLRILDIKGTMTMAWLAVLLTLTHGALYLALDVIPTW